MRSRHAAGSRPDFTRSSLAQGDLWHQAGSSGCLSKGAHMKIDVLVVDDCRDLRETLAAILRQQGFEVALAENGREALAVLERCPEPGLIVLDLMMPVMDGWAFLDACRAHPDVLRRTVVASSLAGPGELTRIRMDYGCRTMGKPFDIDMLIRMARATRSRLVA